MAQTKIIHCSCDIGEGAKYQDKTYGIGKRVHNPTTKGTYRCTVCGDAKNGPAEDKDKKK